MPPVNRLYTEFKRRGLEVLLVAFREDPDVVKQAVRERGYIARVLLDRSGDVTGRTYGVWGPPTVYVIDRQGRLIGRAPGPHAWESPTAREFVLALLQAKP